MSLYSRAYFYYLSALLYVFWRGFTNAIRHTFWTAVMWSYGTSRRISRPIFRTRHKLHSAVCRPGCASRSAEAAPICLLAAPVVSALIIRPVRSGLSVSAVVSCHRYKQSGRSSSQCIVVIARSTAVGGVLHTARLAAGNAGRCLHWESMGSRTSKEIEGRHT